MTIYITKKQMTKSQMPKSQMAKWWNHTINIDLQKNILDWWQNDNDKITIKSDNVKKNHNKNKMTITKWQWQCAKWLN